MFLAIFVGIPGLIFGLPIAFLVALSIRRRSKLSHEQSATSTYAWTLGFLVLLGISVIVFFMTAVGFTT